MLRISPELYEALEAWAQQELRSVNGQIEYLLKEAVRKRGRTVGPDEESSAQAGETVSPHHVQAEPPGEQP